MVDNYHVMSIKRKSIYKIVIPSIVGGIVGAVTLELLFNKYSIIQTFLLFAVLSAIVNYLIIINRKKNIKGHDKQNA